MSGQNRIPPLFIELPVKRVCVFVLRAIKIPLPMIILLILELLYFISILLHNTHKNINNIFL